MGLDISAFTKLSEYKNAPEEYDYEYATDICDNSAFPGVTKPFEGGKIYQSEEKRFVFSAGSYSGYNSWRRQLCKLALGCEPDEVWNNLEKYRGKPFFELINFSDCEGTIGSEVAKKLAKDFADLQPKVDELEEGYFKELFADWKKAFEMASEAGIVDFH